MYRFAAALPFTSRAGLRLAVVLRLRVAVVLRFEVLRRRLLALRRPPMRPAL